MANQADPAGLECIGERVIHFLPRSHLPVLIIYPHALARGVGLERESNVFFGIMQKVEVTFVIKCNEIRVRRYTCFDLATVPRTALSGRLSQLPQVIDSSHPDGRFAVVGHDDMLTAAPLQDRNSVVWGKGME